MDNATATTTAETTKRRIRPGDRLVKSAELRERLSISKMTAWRRQQSDPAFPKPVDDKFIDREIDEYIAVLAARSEAARQAAAQQADGAASAKQLSAQPAA